MKKCIFLLLVISFSHSVFSQNKLVDSLKKWLQENPQQDTMRAMTTHRLSYRLSEINPSDSWKYAKETEELSKQLNFTKGICLSNINYAILESNIGNFKNSAEYYLKAIKIAETIKYQRGISIAYNNIGDNYLKMKDFDKVLEYTQKALELNKSINEVRGQVINLEQIGQVYFLKGDYEKAFYIWDESIRLSENIEDPNIKMQLKIDIAKYYLKKEKMKQAFIYLQIADSLSTNSTELYLQILTNKAYSEGFLKLNLFDSSIIYLKKGLHSSQLMSNKTEECDLYNLISIDFAKKNQYDSAFYYLHKHKMLSDSVLSDKNFAHLTFIQTQYETELKERENQELRLKQISQNRTINTKNGLLIASSIALLFALLSIFLIYRNFSNKKQQLQLEEQKKIADYNQQLAELEIKSLRSQMNPHFLFNSLNSIRNFIIKNEPQLASNYLATFSTLMRKILDSSQQNKIELQEEVEMLKLYIDLELMRFSNKFNYSITIDENLKEQDIEIPSMITQPFVENAIWHGLLSKENNAQLTINFKEIKNNEFEILCEIIDNGVGRIESNKNNNKFKKHKSKGIEITKERLKKLSKITLSEPITIIDLYDSQQNPSGTKVIIHLPIL